MSVAASPTGRAFFCPPPARSLSLRKSSSATPLPVAAVLANMSDVWKSRPSGQRAVDCADDEGRAQRSSEPTSDVPRGVFYITFSR